MYSPTARLLTILEFLQSHRKISGPELARRLEINERTVRRYIVMLQDMGIPVEAERGRYGAYQLQRSYKLPPLMFTEGEAVALTLGLLAIRESRFPVDVAAVVGALAKTERVLPEKLLQQVRALQETITFRGRPRPNMLQNNFLVALSSAAQQRHQVLLRYRSWEGDQTERTFDPYGVVSYDGYWYTAGYCHLRRDLRTFRLDRIIALEASEQLFERPDDFDALTYVLDSLGSTDGGEQVVALMDTTIEHAREMVNLDVVTLEETEEGITYRCSARYLQWAACSLLTLDCPVKVLQPVELRDLLRQMAATALQIIGDEV